MRPRSRTSRAAAQLAANLTGKLGISYQVYCTYHIIRYNAILHYMMSYHVMWYWYYSIRRQDVGPEPQRRVHAAPGEGSALPRRAEWYDNNNNNDNGNNDNSNSNDNTTNNTNNENNNNKNDNNNNTSLDLAFARGRRCARQARPISLLRISLLRLLDSGFPGNSLWTWEFHPLILRCCLSQTLWNPES